MVHDSQPPNGSPTTGDRADQPHQPGPGCQFPSRPDSDANSLEKLIADQTAEIVAAETAKTITADLLALLTNANAASQDYTREKYEKLVRQWVEQDEQIAELIRKLVSAVPCWREVIECYICPLLNEMRYAERQLLGDGTLCTEVQNLYDLQYLRIRDKYAKERRFNRIKAVLVAWEKPATTIERILSDNATRIADASKNLPGNALKLVFDSFFRLVPMHVAVAPPAGSAWHTKIGKEYLQFCGYDTGTSDDCFGPGIDKPSLHQRLIGPQPYLIDPKDYFDVICCLVEKCYRPAKEQLGKAEADLLTVKNEIMRLNALVENGFKSFDKNAKAAIPSEIDCSKFHTNDHGSCEGTLT